LPSAARSGTWGARPPIDDDEARSRLLDAAEACYERRGVSRTTVDDIAREEDLLTYWAAVQRNSSLQLVDAYAPMLSAPQKLHETTRLALAQLLMRTGHEREASRLLEEYPQASSEHTGIFMLGGHPLEGRVKTLVTRCDLLIQSNRLDDAWSLCAECERISREASYRAGLGYALDRQGQILFERGALEGAQRAFEESERIWRELDDLRGVEAALGNRALCRKMQGDLDGALLLQAEEERLCRVLGDQDHLRACLGNQADVYRKRGDFGNAWQFAKQWEDIAPSLGVADGLRRALEMQVTLLRERASALRALGNLTGELKLLRERERICRELRDFDGVARALAMQATNLLDCGEPAGALTVARTALAIARERGLRDHADHVEQLIAIAQLQAEA
jgi:tetratricopeptide (TPR) repeat protein